MTPHYHHTLGKLKSIMRGSESKSINQELNRFFAKHASLNILDIGSGDMSNAYSLSESFSHDKQISIDAVDIYFPDSPFTFRKNVHIERIVGDFNNVELKPLYDLIYCRQSLYYLGDVHAALSKMRGLLKDDGLICIVIWDKSCVLRQLCMCLEETNPASSLTGEVVEHISSDLCFSVSKDLFVSEINFDTQYDTEDNLLSLAKLVSRRGEKTKFVTDKFRELVRNSQPGRRANAILYLKKTSFENKAY